MAATIRGLPALANRHLKLRLVVLHLLYISSICGCGAVTDNFQTGAESQTGDVTDYCPAACTCTDVHSVDCSRLNLTTLPEGISPLVTKL